MALITRPAAALIIPALVLLAAACGGGESAAGPTEAPKTPEDTAERFLSLWRDAEYDNMYGLLSAEARGTIERRKFIERYEAITEEARITSLDYELDPVATGDEASIPFSVTFHTSFFGDIEQDNAIPLVREDVPVPVATGEEPKTREEWRVQWSPALFFTQLDDRSLVHFFTRVPRRGGIYDRNGKELARQGDEVELGGGFNPDDTIFHACGVVSSGPTPVDPATPASGDATLSLAGTWAECCYIEGAMTYVSLSGPTMLDGRPFKDGDELSLAPGHYSLTLYHRPCNVNCDFLLDAPRGHCTTDLDVVSGSKLRAMILWRIEGPCDVSIDG